MHMHKTGKVCQWQAMGRIAMEYYINACERANMKFLHTNENYVKKKKRKKKVCNRDCWHVKIKVQG